MYKKEYVIEVMKLYSLQNTAKKCIISDIIHMTISKQQHAGYLDVNALYLSIYLSLYISIHVL